MTNVNDSLYSHRGELFTRTKLSTPRATATIITCIALTRHHILVSLEVPITSKPQNENQEKQVIQRVTYSVRSNLKEANSNWNGIDSINDTFGSSQMMDS